MEEDQIDGEIFSPYEAQLHELFKSCDKIGKGTLDREGLSSLSHKLGLDQDQSQGLLSKLFCNKKASSKNGLTVSYREFKEGFVRFWKELSFIEGANTRLPGSPINNTTATATNNIKMEEEEVINGFDDDFQTVYLADHIVEKSVKVVDETSALLYVRRVWDEVTSGRAVSDRCQLGQICDIIQPNMLTEEMVEQLFTSLDEDCDGKIRLEDFLELFVGQNGCGNGTNDLFGQSSKTQQRINERLSLSPSVETQSVLSSIQDENLLNGSFLRKMSDCQSTPTHMSDNMNFTNRFTSAEDVLKYWTTIGIEDGEIVLQDLGLYSEEEADLENIDVNELAKILQVELEHCIDSIGLQIPPEEAFMCKAKGRAAARSCCAEVQSLRGTLESVERERQKAIRDLSATNQRVAVFAQDVDEQNARMEETNKEKIRELERHYLSQIKALKGELSQEKEQQVSLTQEIDHKKRYFSLQLSEQENRLKEDLCQLQIENQHLEEENEELKSRLDESERLTVELKSELSKVVNCTGIFSGILVNNNNNSSSQTTTPSPIVTTTTTSTSTDDTIRSNLETELTTLTQRVSELNEQNQQLRSQLQARVHCFEFDFGERGEALDKEIGDTLSQGGLPNDFPHLTNKTSDSTKMNIDVSALTVQIKSIETEMNGLQKQLISALEQLSACKAQQANDEERISSLTEKCVQLQTRLWNSIHPPPSSSSCASTHSLPSDESRVPPTGVSDQPFSLPVSMESSPVTSKKPIELERHCQNLEDELDIVKKEILKILSEKSKCSKENAELKKALQSDLSMTSQHDVHLDSSNPQNLDPKKIQDRYSPDGQEDNSTSKLSSGPFNANGSETSSKEVLARQELEEKCKQLEESLELMQSEFEKMEDYWQNKLDDERRFYEGQIRNSDLRFKELEQKMREYEEMLMNSEDVGKSFEDKLSTIEESASLEGQVEDLESEIETLRNELRDKELRMQKELKEVEAFWQTKLFQEKASHSVETNALKEALNILRRQMASPTTSWTSSATRSKLRTEDEVREDQEEAGDGDGGFDHHVSTGFVGSKPALDSISTSFEGSVCNADPLSSSSGFTVSKPVCDAWTQMPGMAGNPSAALSSVALAYQAVLFDINREKECLRTELERMLRNQKVRPESGLLSTMEIIQSRLKQQEERCQHLQAALKQQQRHSRKILEDMREQHESEIHNLENLMKASQDMLQQQVTKYSDQMQRLGHSESLVRQLLTENETLVTAIRNLQYNVEI